MNSFSFYTKPISNTTPTSVESLSKVHKILTGPNYAFDTRRFRVAGEEAKKKLKSEIFDYVTFSGIFKKRSESNLIAHSGLITLDLDNVTDVLSLKEKILSDNRIVTGLLFRSPSGKGLKWVVPINLETTSHSNWFQAISNYIKAEYSIEVDSSGKDVSRACLLCHDPEAYINPDFLPEKPQPIQQILNPRDWVIINDREDKGINEKLIPDTSAIELNEIVADVENVVQAIENRRIDLTDTYTNWRDIGFALSESLREQGRSFYQRISKFYPDYDELECDKQYSKCLEANGSGITIKTLFFHAKNAGIEIYSIEFDEPASKNQLPTIPEDVYKDLPELFMKITEVTNAATEKDILLLGSIVTLSSAINNIYGVYGGRKVYPNLFFFLEGVAGSGKAILEHCKELVMPIHDNLRAETEKAKVRYHSEMAKYNTEKKEFPDIVKPLPPQEKLLIIPANNSSAGTYQLLNNNEGRGLIFETEGDTLADTFKNQDFGNFSDGFRKAFHHETISSYRKTNNELIEVKNPKLSAVLSGTPKQISNLITDAENGLFSRFAYYSIPMKLHWKNVFAEYQAESLDEYFKNLGIEFFKQYSKAQFAEETKFEFSVNQQKVLNEYFEQQQKKYAFLLGNDFIGAIRRLGLITFRISMIFTAVRLMSKPQPTTRIICEDVDFSNAMKIIKVLIEHANYVFNGLSPIPQLSRKENLKEKFYRLLPEKFNRSSYIKVAESLDLKIKTAELYIKNYCSNNMLNHFAHNQYIKVVSDL